LILLHCTDAAARYPPSLHDALPIYGPFLRSGNERPVSNSGATPPQINCIVHLKWVFSPVLLAQVDLGEVGREFDAEDGGEVVAFPERPPDRQGLAGEAVPGPEPFDGLRVVLGQAPPEPAAECGPGGVVVDDEDGAAAADDPAEFGEAGFAAGAEEVRPPGVGDVDGGVRKRQRLGGADTDGDAGQAAGPAGGRRREARSEEHTSELQSR